MHTIPDRSLQPITGPFPLRHDGFCGTREPCWRPGCRAEFRDVYNTVEVLASGLRLAYCHGESATLADIRRQLAQARRAA